MTTSHKPTLLELYHQHAVLRTTALFEVSDLDRVKILYAFCGFPVSREEAQEVLDIVGYLIGTEYELEDVEGIVFPSTENEKVKGANT